MLEAEDEKEGVQHSASSLEIEGRWSELFPAINLCTPPSAASQFQTLRLYYYLLDLPRTQVGVAHLLDLPARIISPDHLETLTIEVLDELHRDLLSEGQELVFMVDAFRPLLWYRRMVTLHLDLPCNILLDIEFLHALAEVMGGTLRHLVVLKAITHLNGESTSPVLTVDDLPTIAGVNLPRLETLGLDVTWDGKSPSVKWHSLVVSSLLQTLLEKRMTKPGFEPGTSPYLVRACYHYTTRPFSWRNHQLQQTLHGRVESEYAPDSNQ